MHIIKVGLDYHESPLDFREKVTFLKDDISEATRLLEETYNLTEHVIVSTCNRTEIFAVVSNVTEGMDALHRFFVEWFHLTSDEYTNYFLNSKDNDAIKHLFKLTSGLSSMVLGETQILGQIRNAFLEAQKTGTTGKVLNELFKRAITFAKRAHKETLFGEHAVSISYVAVEQVKQMFHDLKSTSVLIVGAGEMGKLALKNLQAAGVKDITVVNRTFARAQELAVEHNVHAVPMKELADALQQTHLLISCTGSSGRVINQDFLKSVQRKRKAMPLAIIDIAVPRDVDTSVNQLPGVTLYDVDDLQVVVDENMAARKEAARTIEKSVGKEVDAFNDWLRMLNAVPIIRALQEKSTSIQKTTLESISRKIPDLTEREMKVLEKHTSSILHQLLEHPIEVVKHMGRQEQSEEQLGLVKHIFGLNTNE